MVDFIPLDLSKHRERFQQLCFETLDWHFKQFKELYDFDLYPHTKKTALQMAEESIETYRNVKPPNGLVYLTKIEDEIIGIP